VAQTLRHALAELVRFETSVPLDLMVVQDRVTRSDGEPLRVAVQRTRRSSTTRFTIRLALHARAICYRPEAVAATLADTLVALYEREACLAASASAHQGEQPPRGVQQCVLGRKQVLLSPDQPNPPRGQVVVPLGRDAWHATAPRAPH
jgi:hypothetical protein